jgi:serine O-acetyltransferase
MLDTVRALDEVVAAAGPVSSTEPDYAREAKPLFGWVPSRSLIASIRAHQRACVSRAPWAMVLRKWASLRHVFWSVVTGADVPLNCRIEGGLLMPHPNGIVIHPDAHIGPNCLIFQQVTIGVAHGGVPRIEGHVDIGAGAKLLGPITVGAHARIGANAVVVDDVPPGATVVGIPGRVV